MRKSEENMVIFVSFWWFFGEIEGGGGRMWSWRDLRKALVMGVHGGSRGIRRGDKLGNAKREKLIMRNRFLDLNGEEMS